MLGVRAKNDQGVSWDSHCQLVVQHHSVLAHVHFLKGVAHYICTNGIEV